MKKIINRKMYNTETAKFLFQIDWYWHRDGEVTVEDVYLKNSGEFFTHERTFKLLEDEKAYKECDDNRIDETIGMLKRENILTETDHDTYMRWCEFNLSVDDYIKIFGEPEE